MQSGSYKIWRSQGLRSSFKGHFLSPQSFPQTLLPHMYKKKKRKKAGDNWYKCLLTIKEAYYFKANTNNPIMFMILQQL